MFFRYLWLYICFSFKGIAHWNKRPAGRLTSANAALSAHGFLILKFKTLGKSPTFEQDRQNKIINGIYEDDPGLKTGINPFQQIFFKKFCPLPCLLSESCAPYLSLRELFPSSFVRKIKLHPEGLHPPACQTMFLR